MPAKINNIEERKIFKGIYPLSDNAKTFLRYAEPKSKNYNHMLNLIIYCDDDLDEMRKWFDAYMEVPVSNRKSCSKHLYMCRYGSKKGSELFYEYSKRKQISINESVKARRDANGGKIITPRMTEHWTKKGFTEEEAKSKIRASATMGGYNAHRSRVKSNPNYKETCVKNINYWTNKGFTEEEAIKIISKSQKTFSLEKCIEKYGSKKGKEVWQTRQDKWQKTLNDKSNEEKREINRRRLNSNNTFSKECIKFNNKLLSDLSFITFDKIYMGINEYFINDGIRFSMYDLTMFCGDIKIIVEYHGTAWHPKEYQFDWKSPVGVTYEEQHSKDINKKLIAEKSGFVYFQIYSDYTSIDYETLKGDIINACKNQNERLISISNET